MAIPQIQSDTFFDPAANDDAIPQLAVNLFASCLDTTPEARSVSWEDLATLLTTPPAVHGSLGLAEYLRADPETRKGEKDHWAWMPASLLVQERGRKQENVGAVSCIVLDCDGGIDIDGAKRRLDGFEAVIHTTYSHTPEKPKFRVVLPLKSPLKPEQLGPLFTSWNAVFDNKLDPACMEPARLFYLPACPPDAKHLFRAERLRGQFLTPAALSAIAPSTPAATARPVASVTPIHGSAKTPLAAVKAELVPVGERNTQLAQFVGAAIAKGYPIEKAMAVSKYWNARLPEPLSANEVERTVQSVYRTAERKAALAQVEVGKAVADMNSKYAFLTKPSLIISLRDRSRQTKEMMRDRYANATVLIGDGDRTKRVSHYQAWSESPARREHINLTFKPGAEVIVDNHVNTWTGWGAEPHPGDVDPWNALLDFLFGAGTPERRYVEQWIAYPIQHPGTKLSTAIVIWSPRQGVGKSLLGETISRLYGKHGKTIGATELHDKFNSWVEDTMFVLGEENSGSDRRADSNRLKHLITGETIHVERKYFDRTEQRNYLNFMFTSNHPDAFHLEIHDRRYFVWAIDAKPQPPSFYADFVRWRDSAAGLPALMHHLRSVDLTGFDPKGQAPETKSKLEMVEQSKTELERWVADVLTSEYIDKHLGAEIVSIKDLVDRFHREAGTTRTNTTALSKALRRLCDYRQNRVSLGSARHNVISLRRHEYWETQDNAMWAVEFQKGRRKAAADSIGGV